MELYEAVKDIMEALGDRVSDFDEHFDVINTAAMQAKPDGTEDFKKKYEDLKAKYVQRFSDQFNIEQDKEGDYALDDVTDPSPAITLDDIDFNASTE